MSDTILRAGLKNNMLKLCLSLLMSAVAGIFADLSAASSGKGILIEAESFRDKGGWVVDQQFMDLMGSPYLLAHGLGVPVKDAVTEVKISRAGTYYIYARTFNWTSRWSDKPGPGKFALSLDNNMLENEIGTSGDKWQWQYAGQADLRKGTVSLSLHDLSGFEGRCDAIFMTTDKSPFLPDGGPELDKLRKTYLPYKASTKRYDFVVVGGGIAGMCAAVTAARNGLTVALVNDRPVLGGNNSSEVRVHLGGEIEIGPNKGLGKMIREFGHSKAGNAKPAANYEDDKKQHFIDSQKGLDLYASCRAVSVRMNDKGNKIQEVLVKNIETGEEYWLEAPLFSDCTGDGTLGYMAGAEWRMGRESRDEFGESLAPEKADSMTMGVSIQWYSKDVGHASTFPEFEYGIHFDSTNCERVTMGEWKWETGMNRNQITEAEQIRDYGFLVIYSNWSWLKNHEPDNARWKNRSLEWVGYISGKRESRRLIGDYILKQDDIDKGGFHEDASFTTTWSIDLHFPDPKNSAKFPGNEFKAATVHNWIHPYAVPYRCLYSRNIDNLFMAGRDISVTHVALGTVRVMRTTGMMGEVVGMAASICHDYSCTPRQVYQTYLDELKAMMRIGAALDTELPDNQKFNLANIYLSAPKALLNDDKDE